MLLVGHDYVHGDVQSGGACYQLGIPPDSRFTHRRRGSARVAYEQPCLLVYRRALLSLSGPVREDAVKVLVLRLLSVRFM